MTIAALALDYGLSTSETYSNDNRSLARFAAERAERGFDRTELLSLDMTLSRFLVAALIELPRDALPAGVHVRCASILQLYGWGLDYSCGDAASCDLAEKVELALISLVAARHARFRDGTTLEDAIASFMAPRLRAFTEHPAGSYPAGFSNRGLWLSAVRAAADALDRREFAGFAFLITFFFKLWS